MVAAAYPGIVYQHAQEEDAQEQYAGYEHQPQEGHELQGIAQLQSKGYDLGQEHHVALQQTKGYDLGEDHHIDYYVSISVLILSDMSDNLEYRNFSSSLVCVALKLKKFYFSSQVLIGFLHLNPKVNSCVTRGLENILVSLKI